MCEWGYVAGQGEGSTLPHIIEFNVPYVLSQLLPFLAPASLKYSGLPSSMYRELVPQKKVGAKKSHVALARD